MSLPVYHSLEHDDQSACKVQPRILIRRRKWIIILGLLVLAIAGLMVVNHSALSFVRTSGDVKASTVAKASDIITQNEQPLVLEPLPPVKEWEFSWPAPLNRPLCLPKIFVYPDDPRMGDFQMQNITVGTAYVAETILLSQLRDPNSVFHKTYVTTNPDEADFFYIPFRGSAYLTHCWYHLHRKDDCKVGPKYVTPMMNHIQQDFSYWNRSNGRDHIMVHPMDKTTEYYGKSRERFMNATFLTTAGDKRYGTVANRLSRRYRDITIPSATIILDLASIDPARYLDANGFPLDGKPRDVFAIFAGIYDKVSRTDFYSSGIRALFHEGIDKLPGYRLSAYWENDQYAQQLVRAKYGLAPQGWTLDTTRIWEYLAFGVVPVIIADGIIEPFEDDIDWNSFSVRIPRSQAHRLDEILRGISQTEYESKRKAVWEHGRQMLLSHDAWHLIVRQLCRMHDDLVGMQTVAGGEHKVIRNSVIKTSRFPRCHKE